MSLRKIIIDILDNYLPVKKLSDPEKQNLKYSIEVKLKESVEGLISNKNYNIQGRTAVGRWADVPWLGIHNKTINSDAQTGIYVTILFSVDGGGFAFSIQQGTEGIGLSTIKERSEKTRKEFHIVDNKYIKSDIDLRGSNSELIDSSRPGLYGFANLVGKEYKKENIPMNIEEDLLEILNIYEQWIGNLHYENNIENTKYENTPEKIEKDESSIPSIRLETGKVKAGNSYPPLDKKEGDLALANSNYKCEANADHETFTTNNDMRYMEKHHLIPMKKYFKFELSIDHSKNIYSLCPNCHRQIHYGKPEDKKQLIDLLFNTRNNIYKEYYNINNAKQIYKYYD